MFELPKFQFFEKVRTRLRRKRKTAPSRPKKPVAPKVHSWLLVAIDAAIGILMRSVTWGLIVAIGALDLFAVFVILVVAYQDTLPVFLVDFVKEYVFSSQKHVRLTLQMLNLDSIADLMRDGLKALGMLWVAVMALTFGATVLTRYVWIRRTQKKLDTDSRLSGKLAPGEVLVPLHDPLMLEMNDDFSRFVHVYAFYLDLRCRSADDASRVALAMEGLKASLSAELIALAESQVVQLKRDAAINALTDAARTATAGGVVGVVLRSSDYNRVRKPESAVLPPPPPGTKTKVKMSTSWGARSSAGTPLPTSGPLSAPPAPAAAEAADTAEPVVAETPSLAPLDPTSLIAGKARDVLAGLRG